MIVAGNHDFCRWRQITGHFPLQKCSVFKKNEIESVYFPELNTEVYGMSYWHREETSDVYDHITPKRQDAINILLAHGGDAKAYTVFSGKDHRERI